MNSVTVTNWALGLAIFSFGFLCIGSVLFGATVITAVLRGLGGGVLFGALIWLVGSLVVKEEDITADLVFEEEDNPDMESTPDKSE